VQDILWASLHKFVEPIFMNWPGKKLREKAVETVMEHIHYEDENTRYICIGPVNKVILRRGKLLWGLPSIVNCLILSAL
jgi:cycloartenol synthase